MDFVDVVGVVDRYRAGLVRVVVGHFPLVGGVADRAVGGVVAVWGDPVELGEQLLQAGNEDPAGQASFLIVTAR
jgi:hypothetical protein